MKTISWRRIEPLSESGRPRDTRFAAMDALRDEWQRQLRALPPDEFKRRRKRTLNRHAVDTGLIAELYQLDRNQVRALVAEGFARDAVARTAGPPEQVMRTLQAQLGALEDMAPEIIEGDRPITASLIRELHAAVCSTQDTYLGRAADGTEIRIPLKHGAWKDLPNTIALGADTIREGCPPEHTQSEVDQLLQWWGQLEQEGDVHALVKIAWFHHRFVQIHPFADGNGRVARVLTSCLMQKHGLPPLVIEAEKREAYFDALARADSVTLTPLATFFMEVSTSAMLREIEPPPYEDASDPHAIAQSMVLAIAARKAAHREAIALNQRTFEQLRRLLDDLVAPWFAQTSESLRLSLQHPDAASNVEVTAIPPVAGQPLGDSWIETHIVAAAQKAKQAYEVRSCVGAVRMKIEVEGEWVIFGAASYRLSPASNVMVLIPFSSAVDHTDRFWYSAHDDPAELTARSTELGSMLSAALGEAMRAFKARLVPNPV